MMVRVQPRLSPSSWLGPRFYLRADFITTRQSSDNLIEQRSDVYLIFLDRACCCCAASASFSFLRCEGGGGAKTLGLAWRKVGTYVV
jgi:hypothetical protein